MDLILKKKEHLKQTNKYQLWREEDRMPQKHTATLEANKDMKTDLTKAHKNIKPLV